MKTKLAIVVVACVTLFVSGCGSSPQDMIVGKWESDQGLGKIAAEFTKDGKATITMFGMPAQGTYKLNGDELEWTLNGQTTKFKAKVTKTELEITSEGKTIKYKKV